MRKKTTRDFAGTEHELQALTHELDDLHHDVGMPAMGEAVGAMRGTSRRTFLMGAGAVAGGAALAAVGGGGLPARRARRLAGRARPAPRPSPRPA